MDFSIRSIVLLFASFFLFVTLSKEGEANQMDTEGIPFTITTGPVQEAWETQTGYELKRRSLHLNEVILQYGKVSSGDKIHFSLFENDEYTATIRRSILDVNNVHTITGKLDGTTYGYFSVSHNNGQTLGTIKIIESNILYRIVTEGDTGTDYLIKIDPALVDELEGAQPLIPEIEGIDDLIDNNQTEILEAEDPVVIDVMIVYTQAAQNWAGGPTGIQNVAAQSMAWGQAAIDNSDVNLEIRLVYSGLVDYAGGPNCSTDLRRLTASPNFNPFGPDFDGYMEEVHEWRNAWGADLVALFTVTNSCGGIAWLLNTPAGLPHYGFSLTRVQQAIGLTHVHELGHNMGNHHSRNQNVNPAPPSGGLYTYSTGWRWWDTDNTHYVSVMTYAEGGQRVPIFSNPDINWHNVPAGSYQGQYAPADNARSMRQIKAVLANYRPTAGGPVLISPVNGTAEESTEWNIIWHKFSGAIGYQIQLSDEIAFLEPLVDEEIADTSYFVDDLDIDTQYFWKVRALSAGTSTEWSEVRSFSTTDGLAFPDRVILTYPPDGEAIVVDESDKSVELVWNSGSPQISNYELEIAVDEEFVDIIYSNDQITETSYLFSDTDDADSYWWRVRAENDTGWGPFSEVWSFLFIVTNVDDGIQAPTVYKLSQNYPNPFNPSTTIRYVLPERSIVKLEIFNILGQRVAILVNSELEMGSYESTWYSDGISSGMYFYRLEAQSSGDPSNRFVETKRMFLLK